MLWFFALICGANVAYMLYFWGRWAMYNPLPRASVADGLSVGLPPVSVVIAARNEAQNLLQNLPLWLSQTYTQPHEVVIINDRSTDDTNHILANFAQKYAHLRIITLNNNTQNHTPTNGKMAALHAGITAAAHTHLLLTDADCAPASPLWLHHIAHTYTPATQIVLGYGKLSTKNNLLGYFIQYDTVITAINYLSYHLAAITYMGVGRNLSYTKQLYTQNFGFDGLPHTAFGDDDLFVAQNATSTNTTICTHPQAHTISAGQGSWRQWFAQKKRHLATAKHYKGKHIFWLSVGFGLFLMKIMAFIALVYVHYQNKNLIEIKTITFLFMATMCIRWSLIAVSAAKLHEKRLVWLLPVVDVLYPVLQLIWAVQGYFFGVNKWK